jgi:hypothetical protein
VRHGTYTAGLEEYAEAVVFAHFIRTGTVPPVAALPRCDRDEYIGGRASLFAHSVPVYPSLFAHSVPLYPYTLAASFSLSFALNDTR